MKKKKNRNLVDLIATAAFLGGLCGMVYSGMTDFDCEQSRARAMATSCMSVLISGIIFALRSEKTR